ncbi:hypothetical protein JS278_02173 [Acidipropionibacterium virtanenii]|uniref:Uncharacterized protein n=1 Tax=Acidipropionibacterium virtanenii TaxID=2057246 RepID=A0A344UVM7_9ACTN|nr:hypothetical protein JS278_02173 [Acidipropionibacterium virtanenii]
MVSIATLGPGGLDGPLLNRVSTFIGRIPVQKVTEEV